jgi:hypothetical protein
MNIAINNIWLCCDCGNEYIPAKDNGTLEDFIYVCQSCLQVM